MSGHNESTPMMRQYRQIRGQLPEDVILFFRLGDFYEMFFEDAKVAAGILDIALTKRQHVPMCGVPVHSANGYLARLLRAGKKVAICEQTEDAALAKGLVQRDITRVVTPGTVLDEEVLEPTRPNYLAAVCEFKGRWGLALLDISTGTFVLEEASDAESMLDSLHRMAPPECLVPEETPTDAPWLRSLRERGNTLITPYEDWVFAPDAALDLLVRHFKVLSLDGFGCSDATAGLGAAGAVLHYARHQLRNPVEHVRHLRRVESSSTLQLDEATTDNLELVEPRHTAQRGKPPTLLHLLDATRTPMGGRLLRDWILRPLQDLHEIRSRHDAVESFCRERAAFRQAGEALSGMRDLERLVVRASTGSGAPRDLLAIAVSLEAVPALRTALGTLPAETWKNRLADLHPLPELVNALRAALADEPASSLKDGGVIRNGFHTELDELRSAATDGRQWLADYQTREQARTGIKNLKVRHNKIFGYYIEISNSNLGQVPDDYQRKQTLVNAERFITPELKEYENKILGAHERAVQLEQELFQELLRKVAEHASNIQKTARAIATVDVLYALADRALTLRYNRPVMDDSLHLEIIEGRHPVIEHIQEGARFVPNDVRMDGSEQQLHIITGPNMAGKSTFIRQVALIVIMAQLGSFVPAASARIGVVDRVFTRVGASDDLARGRSTFMVEMQETANILNNATPRSLVVLDEIGRGTSTFDGISIAWAVAEFLHNTPTVKAKTLFATHYHELTDLARTLRGVKNFSVAVREHKDTISFLRKIIPQAADKSYGIQVARLAGLPQPVIDRAHEILSNLEEGELTESGLPQLARKRPKRPTPTHAQLSLFDDL